MWKKWLAVSLLLGLIPKDLQMNALPVLAILAFAAIIWVKWIKK